MEELNKRNVEDFWDRRAQLVGSIPLINVTSFQETRPGLAESRDKVEKTALWSLLAPCFAKNPRVIDAGCGVGRHSFWLEGYSSDVRAFDLSPALIAICEEEKDRLGSDVRFSVASLDDFHLGIADLILISGVCLFTTDSMWPGIMSSIREASECGTLIVVREAMGSLGRYEIRGQWSSELKCLYSAIYRDPDWFKGLFGQFCDLEYNKALLPPELEKWKETHQRLMLWRVR